MPSDVFMQPLPAGVWPRPSKGKPLLRDLRRGVRLPLFSLERRAKDTLNNPAARLNFLCVELQPTDLFRPSLKQLWKIPAAPTKRKTFGQRFLASYVCVPKPSFDTWLQDTTGRFEGDRFLVTAPNSFVAEMLERRMYSVIAQAVEAVVGDGVAVEFRAQVVDFETGEVLDPPKLADMDDDALCQWLASLGDFNPEWTLYHFGARRIIRFAARMFGEYGDARPDDAIKHPVRILVYNLKQDMAREQALALRPRILDIEDAR